jgi:hypothetical protein
VGMLSWTPPPTSHTHAPVEAPPSDLRAPAERYREIRRGRESAEKVKRGAQGPLPRRRRRHDLGRGEASCSSLYRRDPGLGSGKMLYGCSIRWDRESGKV